MRGATRRRVLVRLDHHRWLLPLPCIKDVKCADYATKEMTHCRIPYTNNLLSCFVLSIMTFEFALCLDVLEAL